MYHYILLFESNSFHCLLTLLYLNPNIQKNKLIHANTINNSTIIISSAESFSKFGMMVKLYVNPSDNSSFKSKFWQYVSFKD